MKFLHIADLHIGKKVHERSMIDEQRHAFVQMHRIAIEQGVSGVLIAGDVFDRPNPSQEALTVAEDMYLGFIRAGIPVYAVPGNHDSAQLVSYCSDLLGVAGLHIAKAYDGHIDSFAVEADGQRPVVIHLLPFVRPTDVRMALMARSQASRSWRPDGLADIMADAAESIKTHDDAVAAALKIHALEEPLTAGADHVLVAHQLVIDGDVNPETCESETVSVGGTDSVQASNFDMFTYVALGHLHGPQRVRRDTVRYSGSPIKYSFSEVRQRKAALIVDITDGKVSFEEIPFEPIRNMREIIGSINDLEAGCDTGNHDDYMRVVLTDRSAYNALDRLRAIYPNLLHLDWQDSLSESQLEELSLAGVRAKSVDELFCDFMEQQTGECPTDEEMALFRRLLAKREGSVA